MVHRFTGVLFPSLESVKQKEAFFFTDLPACPVVHRRIRNINAAYQPASKSVTVDKKNNTRQLQRQLKKYKQQQNKTARRGLSSILRWPRFFFHIITKKRERDWECERGVLARGISLIMGIIR